MVGHLDKTIPLLESDRVIIFGLDNNNEGREYPGCIKGFSKCAHQQVFANALAL